MCLLSLHYRVVEGAPLLVAANREEFFDREWLPPVVLREGRRVICGLDARAGGTWLGVNQDGLVVGITNRRKVRPPRNPRSRGLLCRELLDSPNAQAAARTAASELASGRYDGANYLCADAASAAVTHGGDGTAVVQLGPGHHLLTNGDVNDPHDERQSLARRLFSVRALTSSKEFLAAAKDVCSYRANSSTTRRRVSQNEHGPHIVLRGRNRGTVSSTLIALCAAVSPSQYHFAPGPPDRCEYDDYSQQLREVLD